MYYLAVTGRSINHGTSACNNSHMAAHHNDITGPQIREIADFLIFPDVSPAGRSNVTYVQMSPSSKAAGSISEFQ